MPTVQRQTSFMMSSLMESAKTTPGFLLAAGAVMIIAMATSKKAQKRNQDFC